ncbi:hypothetical protein JTE90_008235 [Oedothorax gibbosus]|uniref:Calcineurin-like phosphoesterase domain-containing protein n=1 Tax=Oedothorax gibbosus TaxID=931172 RepID=A0AAV6ULQ1_9ARAC|nr:hypothetical protein JTE90_008235 [Oedothorax gibbosus]
MLIVGDPQLIGNQYAPSGILGFIFRWDADRYIRKTFALAYNYVNPDLIIFLGDLFDEGEIASDADFILYLKRFKHIFQEVDFDKALIVPGDNDIGGEGHPPLPDMVKRFNKYFKPDSFIQYSFLEFVKANYMTHSNQYEKTPNISQSAFRIILSHIPLTPSYSSFVNRIIPFVLPHIILSAHDHKSQHIVAERKSGIIIQKPSTTDFTSSSFNISEDTIHEIIVPTCSYRMGTLKMGYGVMEISKFGEASYVVLSLPSRFRQLFILLALAVLMLIYSLSYFSRHCHVLNRAFIFFNRNQHKNYVYLNP